MFQDNKDKLFCEVGTDLNLLTKEQVEKALEQQRVDRSIGVNKPIGAYLFEANIITKEQIAQILKIQDKYEKPVPVQGSQQPQPAPVQAGPIPQGSQQPETDSGMGGKIIIFSGIAAFISLFMGWINAGIIQQSGFQQDGYLFLLFCAYPFYKAYYKRPLSKILSGLLLIFSILILGAYIEEKSKVELFGKKLDVVGSGAYLFVLAQLAMLVGVFLYDNRENKPQFQGVHPSSIPPIPPTPAPVKTLPSDANKTLSSKCASCNEEVELEAQELNDGKFCCPKCNKVSVLLSETRKEIEKQSGVEVSFDSKPFEAIQPQPGPQNQSQGEFPRTGLKKINLPLMIFLAVVSGGVFIPIWFLIQRDAINSMTSKDENKLSTNLFYFVAFMFFVTSSLEMGTIWAKTSTWNGILGIIVLVQSFKIRRVFDEFFNARFNRNVSFSGLGLFIFTVFYLQNMINSELLAQDIQEPPVGKQFSEHYGWLASGLGVFFLILAAVCPAAPTKQSNPSMPPATTQGGSQAQIPPQATPQPPQNAPDEFQQLEFSDFKSFPGNIVNKKIKVRMAVGGVFTVPNNNMLWKVEVGDPANGNVLDSAQISVFVADDENFAKAVAKNSNKVVMLCGTLKPGDGAVKYIFDLERIQ